MEGLRYYATTAVVGLIVTLPYLFTSGSLTRWAAHAAVCYGAFVVGGLMYQGAKRFRAVRQARSRDE